MYYKSPNLKQLHHFHCISKHQNTVHDQSYDLNAAVSNEHSCL